MISHEHKCIFIHLPRVAGGSIERALTKKGWSGVRERTPKRCSYRRNPPAGGNWRRDFKIQHEPSCSLKYHYKEFWDKYFKFSFVRNPWDLVVSTFFRGPKIPEPKRFKQYVLNIEDEMHPSIYLDETSKAIWTCNQHKFLFNQKGKNYMDFIGRFENLQKDFNSVCEKIGAPKQKLPHANRSKHKHYAKYYDDDTKEAVAKKFAKDIEMFGYEFGG